MKYKTALRTLTYFLFIVLLSGSALTFLNAISIIFTALEFSFSSSFSQQDFIIFKNALCARFGYFGFGYQEVVLGVFLPC